MLIIHIASLRPLFLLASLVVVEQSTPGGEAVPAMTLEQARGYALGHSPTLQTAKSRLSERQAISEVPRSGWLPKLGAAAELFVSSVNDTTATVAPSPTVEIPRIGGRPASPSGETWTSPGVWRAYPSTLVAIGVTQQIYDFGLLAARTAAADAEVAAERFRLNGSTLDVLLSVDVAYFSARAALAVLDAAVAAERRSQAERDQAEANVRAGLQPPIFLDRAEADLARFQVAVVRARGALAVARTLFASTVGFDGALLDATGQFQPPATLPDLSTSLQMAFARDPHLLELGQELHAREKESQSVWAELRPNVFATATLSTRAGGAPVSAHSGVAPSGGGWVPETPNWDVGVLLSFPILDPVIAARARDSAERERVVQSEILEAKSAVAAAVSQAHELADEARRALPAVQKAFDAAKRNEAQAVARFGAGLGTSVELADAEALLSDAEVQVAIGNFEVGRTEALLERAVGGLP
jgi:outer membrane protein